MCAGGVKIEAAGSMMTIPSTAARGPLDGMMRFWTKGSRLALLLTGLLVLVMPLTEYFWDFDHFLRGGQDIELGLFSVLMVICLILVMLRHVSRGLSLILAIWARLSLIPRDRASRKANLSADRVLELRVLESPIPAISRYSLPILI